jgi:hypothetical protein
MALACGLTSPVLADKIASCACPPALPHHAAKNTDGSWDKLERFETNFVDLSGR